MGKRSPQNARNRSSPDLNNRPESRSVKHEMDPLLGQILQEFSIEQGLIFTKSEPILARYRNQSPQNARNRGFFDWS